MKNIHGSMLTVALAFGGAFVVSSLISAASAQSAALQTTQPVKAVQSTDPVRSTPQFTAQEQGFVGQMQRVISSSQSRGALDTAAMNGVFGAAHRANVKPEVVGQMVSDLVAAFPSSIATIASSAIAPTGGRPSMELVWNVMNSAVMSSPRPFTNVIPVRDAVARAVDFAKVPGMQDYIKYSAVRIASATPDNPMNNVAYNKQQIGTELEQQGLAIKLMEKGSRGFGVLMLDPDIGLNPFFAVPMQTSAKDGANQ